MSNPSFNSGEWNPFEALGRKLSSSRRDGNQEGRLDTLQHGGTKQMKHAAAMQEQHHKNVMDHLERSYQLQTGLMSHQAGLSETSAAGGHQRNLELHGAIHKASEGGTGVGISFPGGGSVSYTKKKPKEKVAKPVAAEPIAPKPEPSPEPGPKPEKYAQRDPKTKKIVGYAEKPQGLLPVKKPAPKKRVTPKKKA